MPTRYLKPGICDSESINLCQPITETLYYRLLVNVDDFGRLDARSAVVRAKCFPLKDNVSNKDVENWLLELNENGLIVLYESSNSIFLQICKWDNVPRSQTSKYPAPPSGYHPKELLEIISENDLEDAICIYIEKSREFAGLQVHSFSRQVRHGESYFDMVLETSIGQIGLELKRSRLSKKAVEQATKYAALANIPFLLIGSGLGVGVDISECENANVCIVTYNQEFIATVIGGKEVVKQRDFTLKQVSTLTGTGTGTGTVNRKPELKQKQKPGKTIVSARDVLTAFGITDDQLATDFIKLRDKKKAAVTQTAMAGIKSQANKAGLSLEDVLRMCCERGWAGFKVEWLKDLKPNGLNNGRDIEAERRAFVDGENVIEGESHHVG